MSRLRQSIISILFAIVLISGLMFPNTFGNNGEVIDQKQEDGSQGSVYLVDNRPTWQSFVPTLPYYTAVEVLLVGQGSATEATLKIREGSITGPELVSVTQTAFSFVGDRWVRFNFSTPVVLSPGSTYVIELDAEFAFHQWRYGNDPYPSGVAAWAGTTRSEYDFAFRTYGYPLAPVGGYAVTVNKLAILTPYLTLVGLIAAVSIIYFIRTRKD
jgi:hypothetical protein